MHRPNRYGSPDPEKLDTTPIAMPIGYMRPTPLEDLIANMVRQVVSQEKQEEFETPEESDDFEMDDDSLLDLSPYTLTDLTEEEPLETVQPDDVPAPAPDPEPDPEPDPTDGPDPSS